MWKLCQTIFDMFFRLLLIDSSKVSIIQSSFTCVSHSSYSHSSNGYTMSNYCTTLFSIENTKICFLTLINQFNFKNIHRIGLLNSFWYLKLFNFRSPSILSHIFLWCSKFIHERSKGVWSLCLRHLKTRFEAFSLFHVYEIY